MENKIEWEYGVWERARRERNKEREKARYREQGEEEGVDLGLKEQNKYKREW